MINLLPPEYRQSQRFSRTNTRLTRWLLVGVVLVAGLALIVTSSWLYTDRQIKQIDSSIEKTQGLLKTQNLEKVQKQADEISRNVRIINQVLSREIRFSALIQEIGKVMPPGTVLSSLTLTRVNGALDLTANAKNYSTATRIAVNLSDPGNKLFDKVDIVNINCADAEGPYDCSASLRVLFGEEASSRFLNVSGDN